MFGKGITKRVKIKNIITVALFGVGIGFFLTYRFFISPTINSKPGEVLTPSNISNKIILKDIIIDNIRKKHELITMEVDLSQKITIDNSWGSLSLFKKISNINYVGTGTYTIDFMNIKPENIKIEDKIITLKLAKPEIKYINIDDNKTTCESTKNGLLRFGEIKMSPVENQELHRKVSEQMSAKMKASELYNKAIENSKQAAKTIISKILILNTTSQYEVNIKFEN